MTSFLFSSRWNFAFIDYKNSIKKNQNRKVLVVLFFQVENGINPVFSAKEETSNSGDEEQWITIIHDDLLPFLCHLIL